MNIPALMADDAPLAFITFSADMKQIHWANQAAQEWLGLSLRHLSGKSLSDIFTDFDAVLKAGKRCQTSLSPVSLFDYLIKRSGQTDQRAQIMIYPTGDHLGLIVQIIGSQPSREERSSGQAVSAMGRMLTHEIKNPLAGIDGAAQLLREDVTTEEGKDLIDLIRSEIDRIRRLADRMETLGDFDPENVQVINIHELLSKARRIMETGVNNGIAFHENYDPSLPIALGDPDSLMQAIINLIKNASESIERGEQPGQIHLETSFRSGVTRRGPSGQSERQLPIEIRIRDNGPGISDDVRSRIFQPFITNKPTGQGLGLALVSKVAAAHGGIVELESRPGHTAFSILLPAPHKEKT